MREGPMRRIVSEEEIKSAIFAPPETTRAFFRGRAVARFNREITSIQWDEIAFKQDGRSQLVTLPEPAGDARLEILNELINAENGFAAFFKSWHALDATARAAAWGSARVSRAGGPESVRGRAFSFARCQVGYATGKDSVGERRKQRARRACYPGGRTADSDVHDQVIKR